MLRDPLLTQLGFDPRMEQSGGGPLSLTHTNNLPSCSSLPKHLPQTCPPPPINSVVLISFGAETLTLKSYILPYSIVYIINHIEFVLLIKPKFWNSKAFSVPQMVSKTKDALTFCALDFFKMYLGTQLVFCFPQVFLCPWGNIE